MHLQTEVSCGIFHKWLVLYRLSETIAFYKIYTKSTLEYFQEFCRTLSSFHHTKSVEGPYNKLFKMKLASCFFSKHYDSDL